MVQKFIDDVIVSQESEESPKRPSISNYIKYV